MLELDAVTFSYPGASRPSLIEASATIVPSAISLFWGDNGAGKSTLSLALSGVIPWVVGGNYSGELRWCGEPVSALDVPDLVSLVFQDPQVYFRGHSIETEIDFVAAKKSPLWNSVVDLLPKAASHQPLHRLSGGEQQRVAICSAALRDTPLILFDEPLEFLDPEGAQAAVRLLNEVSGMRAVGLFHRRVRWLADLHIGGAYRVVDGGVQAGVPVAEEPLRALRSRPSSTVCLHIDDLDFRYPRATTAVLRAASFEIREGESVGLVGANGSGKTTLMMLVAGLVPAQGGRIALAGSSVTRSRLRQSVRCVFQNPEHQIFCSSVADEIAFSVERLSLNPAEADSRIDSALNSLPFPATADPFALSFGQKKLLAIAGALAARPSVLLVDEPFAGLDRFGREHLSLALDRFLSQGGALLVSAHDRADVLEISHRTLVLEDGRICES